MIINQRKKILAIFILLFALITVVSANGDNIAQVTITEQSIKITGNEGYSNITLTVAGPNGFYVQNTLGDAPVSWLIDDVNSLKDGSYNYELTAATGSSDNQWQLNSGRDNNSATISNSAMQSGSFRISNGQIVVSESRNRRMMTEGGDQDEA